MHKSSNYLRYIKNVIPKKNPFLCDSLELMVNFGYIHHGSVSGTYNLLPLSQRIMDKIAHLLNYSMQTVQACRVTMPSLASQNIWQTSNRLNNGNDLMNKTASDIFQLVDRGRNRLCLNPTHEEAICALVKECFNSVPTFHTKNTNQKIFLYQIGTKYRDEAKPKLGLLRTREFCMKDAYAFDSDRESALKTYHNIRNLYERIFSVLLHLPNQLSNMNDKKHGDGVQNNFAKLDRAYSFYTVQIGELTPIENKSNINSYDYSPDAGLMDGTSLLSHEFHIPSPIGEDKILICPNCGYAQINKETTDSHNSNIQNDYHNDFQIDDITSSSSNKNINTIRDKAHVRNYTTANGNQKNKNTNILENIDNDEINSTNNDLECPYCAIKSKTSSESGQIKHYLKSINSIEIGHTFYLGDRFSKPFKITVDGFNQFSQMTCFGIGVTRLIAAALECALQFNKNETHSASKTPTSLLMNCRWPLMISPFTFAYIPPKKGSREEEHLKKYGNDFEKSIHSSDSQMIRDDLVFEDRIQYTIGRRLKEIQMIGVPYIIVAGKTIFQNPMKYEWWDMYKDKENQCSFLTITEIWQNIQSVLESKRHLLSHIDCK